MFKRLFGGGSRSDERLSPLGATAQAGPSAVTVQAETKLLLLPESDAEWIPVRAADSLGGDSLLIDAALMPRVDHTLKDARVHRKPIGGTTGQITVENLGDGRFTHLLSPPDVGAPEILPELAGDPFPVLLYPLYDGRADSEEAVCVMRLAEGGTVVGFLQPERDSPFADGYNGLLLNLELRTGVYGSCLARVDADGARIDLARYEVCFNRCQRLLHERNAGAKYST